MLDLVQLQALAPRVVPCYQSLKENQSKAEGEDNV